MSTDETPPANTNAKQKRGKPFVKGQVANPKGRPPGSRNKIAESYIAAMSAKFEEQGEKIIDEIIRDKPEVFLKCVHDLVPKEFGLNLNATDAFVNLFKMVSNGGPSERNS